MNIITTSIKPTFFLLVTIIMLLQPYEGKARIGETPQECIKRYGQPTSGPERCQVSRKLGVGAYSYFFRKNKLNIALVFSNEKAELITYAKQNHFDNFSKLETDILLEENRPIKSSPRYWIQDTPDVWLGSEKSRLATLQHDLESPTTFSIYTKNAVIKSGGPDKEEENSLKGF